MSTSPDTDDESLAVFEPTVRELTPSDETLRLREQATIDAVETIPVPAQRARRGEDFAVVTNDVTAWPDQRLEWHFAYNEFMGRWLFECRHEQMGTLFDGRSVATLGRDYSAYPYLLARFIAPGGDSPGNHIDAITPQTLTDAVSLAVMPGPAGGSFLDEANLTDAEEDALLARYASDYPVTGAWV